MKKQLHVNRRLGRPVILAFLLTLLLAAAKGSEVRAQEKEEWTIHDGVYIDGIDVSGMTESQARREIEAYVRQQGEETLTLEIFEDQLEVGLADLGLRCANLDVIHEAASLGKSGNLLRRYKERKELEHENRVFELEWELDSARVSDYVKTECIQFDQEATDATLQKKGDSFEVIPGEAGVKLDVGGSVQAIQDFIKNEWSHENGTVALPVETDYPRGSEEELGRVKDVLGTYSTNYAGPGANRIQNIVNAAKILDGIVLYPGDTGSFDEKARPYTVANGYVPAGSYLNGKVVDSMGGGICQVSTTLYNAVLLAELEVVERSNHSMLVSYVPPAADAAISESYKDFKFKNNTQTPIYIEAVAVNNILTFTIYGEETRPANRTIKYQSVTLSTTDPGQVIVADPGQPIGFKAIDGAHMGAVAELYKHVYVNGVEESVTKVNKSSYRASPRTITIGVAGDPALSEELQAAVATQDEATVDATLASCMERMNQGQ